LIFSCFIPIYFCVTTIIIYTYIYIK
jgi:hypothetical protein